ncbi:hypothetical protein AB0I60_12900 [Actinosynnema sp. NPDC050436]|uniref:hypothetical protein n=1 Tax=Actinosynnema sp. NPDC050436 TaxID=3155659 RepID=UPI00340FD0BF
MREFVVVVCAALAVAGCSAEAGPAKPDRSGALRELVLPDDVTAPHGLVRAGEPVAGVRELVECPDLASADQAEAGVTATWTWSRDGREVTLTQYNAVYRVPGRDVVEQARTASNCHRAEESGRLRADLDTDEYFHLNTALPATTPAVDDRYAYCVTNRVREHSVCTGILAKGDEVVRLTVDGKGDRRGMESPSVEMFAQALTDRLST